MTLTVDTATAVEQLALELADLRRELAALRDALAVEVRTRRLIVADGDRSVEIRPGAVSIDDECNGCRVLLGTFADRAEIHVTAGDVVPPRISPANEIVSMLAWVDGDQEPGGPHAEVLVNCHELAVPAAASR